MKEFLVGLLVLVLACVMLVVGVLLFPLLLLLGIFLRVIVGFLIVLVVIWLVGKLTLLFLRSFSSKEPSKDLEKL